MGESPALPDRTLVLLATGHGNQEIAAALALSVRTVENHIFTAD